MKYKSKIDWWFHLCVVLSALFTGYIFYLALNGDPTMALASVMFAAMLFLFMLPTYLLTYYVFEDKHLVIRSGLFSKRKILYTDIVSWQAGSVTGENAALSKDRIVIFYMRGGKKRSINVSPKNKFDFQTELKINTQSEDEKG